MEFTWKEDGMEEGWGRSTEGRGVFEGGLTGVKNIQREHRQEGRLEGGTVWRNIERRGKSNGGEMEGI